MGDNFQGTDSVTLQPGDVNVPVFLRLKACSASTKNDGSMPYGSSVISSSATAHKSVGGADATANLIGSSTEVGNSIVVYLTYNAALEKGLYNLTAKVTMDLDGAAFNMTREYDLNRIYVRDL